MHGRVSSIMVTLRQRHGTVGNKRKTMKFDDRTHTVDSAIDSTRQKGRETKREKREFPVWSARGPQEGKWPRAAYAYVCRESVVKNAGGGKGASDIFSGGEGPPRASINATPSVIWLGDNGFEHVRPPPRESALLRHEWDALCRFNPPVDLCFWDRCWVTKRETGREWHCIELNFVFSEEKVSRRKGNEQQCYVDVERCIRNKAQTIADREFWISRMGIVWDKDTSAGV